MKLTKSTEPQKFLSGWKQIANYLGKGVRTVQRYERTLGLPIHRPKRISGGSVIATKADLDAWVTTGHGQILSPMTRNRINCVGADFLCIDAEMALTFSGLALESVDPENKRRRAEKARKAYDTIMQLRRNVDLSDKQRNKLNTALERLKNELQSLGERFKHFR